MNKDVVGLIHWIEYRLRIENIVKEYRSDFEFSAIGFSYSASDWGLNWRVKDMFTKYSAYIYNFRTMEQQGVLPRNYF